MADPRPNSSAGSPTASVEDHTSGPAGFAALGVPSVLVDRLSAAGIDQPFPIQTATMADAIAGRDILGRGRTGSGKTLAFVLPVLIRLSLSRSRSAGRRPRALILAPTRELARQILQVIEPLASAFGLKATTVFGGVPAGAQITALKRGVDILVACPGRLEDLIRSGACRLGEVEVTVLDEADHMSDLGFLPSVRRLLDQTPADGQRMLYSATLDSAVDVLVKRYLSDPAVHSVDDEGVPTAEMVHHVLHISAPDRIPVLVDLTSTPGRKVVFTRTKHRARTLARQLVAAGVPAVEMHGNLSQAARIRNLERFSTGNAVVLVATDIAARGLHIDDVELVIHADPPLEHKTYLHRSGRTARAGAGGTVVTLATEEQRAEVAKLGKRAGVNPAVTQYRPGTANLADLFSSVATVTRHELATPRVKVASGAPSAPSPAKTKAAIRRRRRPTGGPTASGGRDTGRQARG